MPPGEQPVLQVRPHPGDAVTHRREAVSDPRDTLLHGLVHVEGDVRRAHVQQPLDALPYVVHAHPELGELVTDPQHALLQGVERRLDAVLPVVPNGTSDPLPDRLDDVVVEPLKHRPEDVPDEPPKSLENRLDEVVPGEQDDHADGVERRLDHVFVEPLDDRAQDVRNEPTEGLKDRLDEVVPGERNDRRDGSPDGLDHVLVEPGEHRSDASKDARDDRPDVGLEPGDEIAYDLTDECPGRLDDVDPEPHELRTDPPQHSQEHGPRRLHKPVHDRADRDLDPRPHGVHSGLEPADAVVREDERTDEQTNRCDDCHDRPVHRGDRRRESALRGSQRPRHTSPDAIRGGHDADAGRERTPDRGVLRQPVVGVTEGVRHTFHEPSEPRRSDVVSAVRPRHTERPQAPSERLDCGDRLLPDEPEDLRQDRQKQLAHLGLQVVPLRGHDLLLLGERVRLAGEVPVRVGGLIHDQGQGRGLVSLRRQGTAGLLEPELGGLRINRGLVQRHAVLLNRVSLALQGRRQGLHSLGGLPAEHGGQIRTQGNQVVGLRAELVHGGAAILELRPNQCPELVELVLRQANGASSSVRPVQHLARGVTEDRVDRTHGLLEVTGALHRGPQGLPNLLHTHVRGHAGHGALERRLEPVTGLTSPTLGLILSLVSRGLHPTLQIAGDLLPDTTPPGRILLRALRLTGLTVSRVGGVIHATNHETADLLAHATPPRGVLLRSGLRPASSALRGLLGLAERVLRIRELAVQLVLLLPGPHGRGFQLLLCDRETVLRGESLRGLLPVLLHGLSELRLRNIDLALRVLLLRRVALNRSGGTLLGALHISAQLVHVRLRAIEGLRHGLADLLTSLRALTLRSLEGPANLRTDLRRVHREGHIPGSELNSRCHGRTSRGQQKAPTTVGAFLSTCAPRSGTRYVRGHRPQ